MVLHTFNFVPLSIFFLITKIIIGMCVSCNVTFKNISEIFSSILLLNIGFVGEIVRGEEEKSFFGYFVYKRKIVRLFVSQIIKLKKKG